MGPGRKMELPYRRYSVPETVMRKYWMNREKANAKNMVDKSAQTEWRPCVVWTEASSNGSVGRSASEPWLQGTVEFRGTCRPVTAPSTPSWSSTTLPPATTSAPTSSTSTSLPSTDPNRSPRPPPSVQVLCFHHGVSKSDVKIQFPEPSESSRSDDTPSYVDVGVNTDYTPPPTPTPEETSHDVAVQTASRPQTSSDESIPNSKLCQTDFSLSPPPAVTPVSDVAKRVDFTCQTEGAFDEKAKKDVPKLPPEKKSDKSEAKVKTEKNKEASCSTGNYKEYPGTEMIIPRYSAVPRTGSMVVNIPSLDNSDSDLSLTDSLEDPCEGFITEWPENKLDNRLVRGEVSQIPLNSNRSFIRSKNTCAYFLFLSGEEGSIKEYKVPHKVEARLRRREEEIKKIYDLKYRKFPQITYRKKRRTQPIVLREMESQTNITKSVNIGGGETNKKKLGFSKSFDLSCECSTSKNDKNKDAPTKKLDRSKTISSFNIHSEQGENTDRTQESKEQISQSESSDEKTPRISLTLTVPSRSKRKNEEGIDDKVARILMQSLEEIRSKQHVVHTGISTNKKTSTSDLSQHFVRKAEAMTKSMPSTSKTSKDDQVKSRGGEKWDVLRQRVPEEPAPAVRSCYHPNIKYEEVRSRTQMKDQLENGDPTNNNMESSHSYLKVCKENRQYEQTCDYHDDIRVPKKEKPVEDEELLRAVLKKSMQPKMPTSFCSGTGETQSKPDGHSEVCELGLKFLSNEIDIDQFIAGIPLERIEQDVKKLMYKHYLGSNPEAKESDSAYESLMKKKMVVSFVDNEKTEVAEKSQIQTNMKQVSSCFSCGKSMTNQSQSSDIKKTSDYGSFSSMDGASSRRTVHTCCHHCLSQIYNNSDDEPEKLEKSVSPLDKSVATAVQTIDSFLDSERLPVVNEIAESQIESIISCIKHNEHCKYNGDKSGVTYSKFCSCKNSNEGVDPQKNINPPNNHSPLNKTYYSPRPVKSCIKNNLDQKSGQRIDVEIHQTGTKKNPQKESMQGDIRALKVQGSKKSKNEFNTASKDQVTHSKEPLEVKVVDNKGNVLSKGSRNTLRSEKKITKFGVNKKSQNLGSKYTQIFEVIPEERNTPDYLEDYELKDSRRKTNVSTNQYGLPKQHRLKTHLTSTGTDPLALHQSDAPKKFVSRAVETISQKSVSTMVNFDPSGREESKRSEMVKKDKSSKSYQNKSRNTDDRLEREVYIEDLKQPLDKKGVVIGKFHPVPDQSVLSEQSVAKTKNRSNHRQESSEDMLSLSKGWINFYLVRDNDVTENTDKDNNRPHMGYDDGQRGYMRKNIQKGTQTSDKQIQLPNLTRYESRKRYKSSSECSNVSLPGIRSSSSSGPSSPENVPRGQYLRKHDPLPQLTGEACVKKKKKHSFYNSGNHSNKSDSCFSREGERTTRRVEVSRSEHSISSVTSSSIVMSGSPDDSRQLERKQRKSKTPGAPSNQSDSGSCWTVTVAGSGGTGNQPPPDVEMRLSFAGQRDEEVVEEKIDSDNSFQYSSGEPVSSVTMSKRVGPGRNQNTRMYYDSEELQTKSRKVGSDEEWISERRNGILHVTGSAITPEEKPRVPTQSERDLVRSHRYRFTR